MNMTSSSLGVPAIGSNAASRTSDRLGRGWPFPVDMTPELRHLRYELGPEKVRTAIRLILETEPGERVMRPTFGCGLRQFLMQPNSVATRALIQREVARALDQWEPRIDVKEVTVEPGDDAALVLITMRYEYRKDGRPDLLVFPYSLEARS